MRFHRWLAAGTAALLALGAAACGSSDSSTSSSGASSSSGSSKVSGSISGAGSTLAAPIYSQWGSNLKGQGITLNFQPVGSGAGVTAWEQGTADFAGSDPALGDDEIAAASKKEGAPIHIPTVFGGITVSYNLSGVKAGLKLDGKTIADIYLDKVKKWNDPEIAGQNPGTTLPDKPITVIHRSDSSGTTKGFTQFMANYSPEWKSGPGVDKTIKWPTGTGAKGNNGVAAAVKQTDGADRLRRAGLRAAEQLHLRSGEEQERQVRLADARIHLGRRRRPDSPGRPALHGHRRAGPHRLPDRVADVRDRPHRPVQGRDDRAEGQGVQGLHRLRPGTDGQNAAKQLSYAPLPSALLEKAKAQVTKLQCNGSPLS